MEDKPEPKPESKPESKPETKTESNPESKTPFWSTVPGILTALGGVVVAVTGLLSVLLTTGVIGPKANTNTTPPANSTATLASTPSNSTSANAETDRYKSLTGKWEVIEEPSQDFSDVKKVTWQYDAVVSGNELTFTGKITALDGDKNLHEDIEAYRSTFVSTLIGSTGVGEYKVKAEEGGTTTIYPATIRFNDKFTGFQGSVDPKGQERSSLSGKKQ